MAQKTAKTWRGEEGMSMLGDVQLADGRLVRERTERVKMFSALAEQIGEDNLVGEPTEMVMTPEEAQRQLKEVMRQDGPYLDAGHPEHDAYVAEAQRLFALMA